jgi:hypothetical protein
MLNLRKTNEICRVLKETYNTNLLRSYEQIEDIFFDVRDLYEENPNRFPNANKTLLSLIYNLANPENQPNVKYITGPGEISKWESIKYNKIIYIFGEKDHSNGSGCVIEGVNMKGKKHMNIEKYLLELFKNSPTFIDFYVEFGIMIDDIQHISTSSGQTLWDMLSVMKGCFGPLSERDCPYNVRMHGVDTRSIISDKYKTSKLSEMVSDLMMEIVYMKKNERYMKADEFSIKYKDQIDVLSNVENNDELIKIIRKDIMNNKLIKKELKRSTLDKKKLIKFFLTKKLKESFYILGFNSYDVGKWFSSLKKMKYIWPYGIESVSYILTVVNSVTMDIYTTARMFKIFRVTEGDYYPKEPHNIIYYAGTGHTIRMESFLKKIGFKMTEKSKSDMRSCVSLEGIKQPLFS